MFPLCAILCALLCAPMCPYVQLCAPPCAPLCAPMSPLCAPYMPLCAPLCNQLCTLCAPMCSAMCPYVLCYVLHYVLLCAPMCSPMCFMCSSMLPICSTMYPYVLPMCPYILRSYTQYKNIEHWRCITACLGYHWLSLATIDLVDDNREFEVLGIFWSVIPIYILLFRGFQRLEEAPSFVTLGWVIICNLNFKRTENHNFTTTTNEPACGILSLLDILKFLWNFGKNPIISCLKCTVNSNTVNSKFHELEGNLTVV